MTLHPEQTPSGVLYSPRQISLATLLGTPVAAAWFFYRNYLTLADDRRARRSLRFGAGAIAVVVTLALMLPSRFPKELVPILYTLAIDIYASTIFLKQFEKHVDAGGLRGSWLTVVGVSLFTLLVVFGVLFAVVSVMPAIIPSRQ